jgi:hypothetical protein
MKETRRTKKQRWGCHALPARFAKRKFPSDSNYQMTNKNMMNRKNPNLGCQTTFKLSNTWGLQSNNYAKFATTPHWHSTVVVEQITQRFHWKMERARKTVDKQFQINLHTTSVD